MIARTPALTYASELLVENGLSDHRAWVREGHEAFRLWIAEDCMTSLTVAAWGKMTVRDWTFAMADEWVRGTEAGRAFAERVAEEAK